MRAGIPGISNPKTRMKVKKQLILLFFIMVRPVFILNGYANLMAESLLKRQVTSAYAELNRQSYALINPVDRRFRRRGRAVFAVRSESGGGLLVCRQTGQPVYAQGRGATKMDKKTGESLQTVSLPEGSESYYTDWSDRILGSNVPSRIGDVLELPAELKLGFLSEGAANVISSNFIYVMHSGVRC